MSNEKTFEFGSIPELVTIDLEQFGSQPSDQGLISPEGVPFTSIWSDPAQIDEHIKAVPEEFQKRTMTAVTDPSQIEEAKRKVQEKEDELASLSMEDMFFEKQSELKEDFKSSDFENMVGGKLHIADPKLFKISPTGAFDKVMLEGYTSAHNAEQKIIEDLLHERIPKYAGNDAENPMTATDRDLLSRKHYNFADRRAYWKRTYGDDARYFRVPVTYDEKNKTTVYEEMFSLTNDGDIFRVDPSGVITLKELHRDLGDISGQFVNLRTGMTLGSVFLGPGGILSLPTIFGSSYLGQIFYTEIYFRIFNNIENIFIYILYILKI